MSLSIRPPTPPPQHAITSTTSSRTVGRVHAPDDEDPVFRMVDIRAIVGFPLRAVRRRRRLALALFLGVVALTSAAVAVMPRHYLTQTKFFAQKNFVMPALNNPRRTVPGESDAPTKLAMDAVMKRENLIQVIRETNLMSTWTQMRSPVGKAKDAMLRLMHRTMSDSDRVDAMVGLMQRQMWVVSDEGTVTIGVDWGDPASAFRIVQAAQQNFFEDRHITEVSMIGESIAILEGHVETARQAIQDAVVQINTVAHRGARTAGPVASMAAPRADVGVIATLQAQLNSKLQAITDVESSRNQRLQALQLRLAELRNTLGAAHPEIASTQESIRAVSTDSPQLMQLRTDERSLRAQLAVHGVRPGEIGPAQAPGLEASLARATLERLSQRPAVDSIEDPQVTYARSQLKIATSDYEDLLGRLEGARIELETARAAFKYRYNVIMPARVPNRSMKPNVPVMILAGAIGAMVLAVFAATTLDFLSGRMLERWQVDRQLGLPVLAELHLP